MKLYKNYIFINLAKPLLVTTFTLAGVLWLTRAIRFLKYITEDGVGLTVFLKLSLFILPALLVVIIPLAVFVTAIITYNKLIEDREIVILQGAGLKKFSLVTPAVTIALIAVVICYFITIFFMPFANRAIRNIREEIKNNYSSIMVEENTFNKLRNITIYVKDKDEHGELKGVLIYDNKSYNPKTADEKHSLVYAKRGSFKGTMLELYDGNIQKFLNKNENMPEILFFESYSLDLSEYDSKKIQFVLKLSDMYLNELFNLYKKGDELFTKEQILAEINYRLTFPLFSIILTLIGSSFILYGGFQRTGKNKNAISSSAVVMIFFLVSMYLYKLAESIVIANYVLYGLMAFSLIVSLILVRDIKYEKIKHRRK